MAGSDLADTHQMGAAPALVPVIQGLFDSCQGEPPLLQVSDQPQAVAVLGAVVTHPALAPRGREQSSVLVEPALSKWESPTYGRVRRSSSPALIDRGHTDMMCRLSLVRGWLPSKAVAANVDAVQPARPGEDLSVGCEQGVTAE